MFEYCLAISIIAFVYADLLTDSTMIFGKLYLFLEKHLPEIVFNPIIGCSKCVSGQIALWHYLLLSKFEYNWENHIFIVCLTILLTTTIKILYEWTKRKQFTS
jgi:hypothetical protein